MQFTEPTEIRVVAPAPTPFVMGINYWPRRKAMYWWKQFDNGEVKDEFAQVGDLGAQVVRIFLMWEDFQPEPWRLDSRRLDDLAAVLDSAEAARIRVMPSFLTGNMSGAFWIPSWALAEGPKGTFSSEVVEGQYDNRRIRAIFEDPFMLRAELFQVRGVVSRFADHPAIFGWDLASELDQVTAPRSYDGGWLWSYLLSEEVRKIDQAHPVTYGAHSPSLSRYNGLSIVDLAETNDYLSMHGYPLYSEVSRGPLDSDFVPFLNQLTQWLGAKPTLFQEFGLCTAPAGEKGHYIGDLLLGQQKEQYLASEEEGARYYGEVLEKLYRAGSLGAFAWCYSDYDPGLWDRPPLDRAVRERFFGLTRADGSIKPIGMEFRRFAREVKSAKKKGWGSKRLSFPISAQEYYQDPDRHFSEMYKWYLARG